MIARLADCLPDWMTARAEPDGLGLFAHNALHRLETALAPIETRAPRES